MTSRIDRVNEELREILAEEIQRLKDPRLGFVTVTGVKVTPDLRKARVFYTVLGEEKQHRGTAAALRSARSHLRVALGREIRLKVTPELEFTEDETAERGQRIEDILTRIHEEERERGTGPSG
jgi:ribosome-binding factor A